MRPLLFSKSRAFERRAHGGLRVTFPGGKIPRRFRAMAQRWDLRRAATPCAKPASTCQVLRSRSRFHRGAAASAAATGWAAPVPGVGDCTYGATSRETPKRFLGSLWETVRKSLQLACSEYLLARASAQGFANQPTSSRKRSQTSEDFSQSLTIFRQLVALAFRSDYPLRLGNLQRGHNLPEQGICVLSSALPVSCHLLEESHGFLRVCIW